MEQIIPKLPNDINRFIDVFGGGFNVGINVPAKTVIYNDTIKEVSQLIQTLYETELDIILQRIDTLINKYDLSKTNQQGFLELREYYNKNKSPIEFYVLVCYAFNNQIRFNSKGEFNMPFGKDRSSFNPTLREKFCMFVNELQSKNCQFFSNDFRKLKLSNLKEDDFVYCDPPYLNTTASYNENGGWTIEDELALRDMLIQLHNSEVKFGLSNNATTNETLLKWAEENGLYIHHLNINYNNCNYQKKDKGKDDEVYITNILIR